MSAGLPSLALLARNLGDIRTRQQEQTLDYIVGVEGETFPTDGREPALRTKTQLENALQRSKALIERAPGTLAVGISAEDKSAHKLQAYIVRRAPDLRITIRTGIVDATSMRVLDSKPLIEAHPDLFFTWQGVEGFARLWFDTLS
jgi:hypothetical protein